VSFGEICDHGNDASSIIRGKFPDQPSDYQVLKGKCAPGSYKD
jgi:hypothetical protein